LLPLELAEVGYASLILCISASVDGVDFVDPTPSIEVLQLQHIAQRPMEVVGDVCYLLIELVEGVAGYPPTSLMLTSTSVPQFGHLVWATAEPSALMRR
jgi:hypothetical protein